jgi:hypothetical protein
MGSYIFHSSGHHYWELPGVFQSGLQENRFHVFDPECLEGPWALLLFPRRSLGLGVREMKREKKKKIADGLLLKLHTS